MRILPGEAPDQATIDPEFPGARLRIFGLGADELRAVLRGEPAGRTLWQPGLSISAELADAPAEPTGNPQTLELEDGRVHLQSGAGGRIEVSAEHAIGDTLLPRSLNLLLAQQWGRVGLMMVHGAAFRYRGAGILVLGRQGAGKSTLTTAALAAGGEVVSDDWLLLGAGPSDAFHVQRLRHFLMFRENPATRTLLSAIPGLWLHPARQGSKLVAEIDRQPDSLIARFIDSTRIDRIWLLEDRPGSRPAACRQREAGGTDAMAMLVEATMPLLFSSAFPEERRALLAAVNRMSRDIPVLWLRTGDELLDTPAQTLSNLIEVRHRNIGPKV